MPDFWNHHNHFLSKVAAFYFTDLFFPPSRLSLLSSDGSLCYVKSLTGQRHDRVQLKANNCNHGHGNMVWPWFSCGTVCVYPQFSYRDNDTIFWIFPVVPCHAFCM